MSDKPICNEPLAPAPFPSYLSARCEFDRGHTGAHGMRGRIGPTVTNCHIREVAGCGTYLIAGGGGTHLKSVSADVVE